MVSAAQIREVVSSYLTHDDGERFLLAFSPLSHNIHKNGEAEAVELANKIEMRMADLHAQLISKSEFRGFLRELAIPPFSYAYQGSPKVFTASASGAVQVKTGLNWESLEASSIRFADRQYA